MSNKHRRIKRLTISFFALYFCIAVVSCIGIGQAFGGLQAVGAAH